MATMELKPVYQGTFGTVSVARLLLRLSMAGETGALKITDANGTPTVILFFEGTLIDLTSARKDISLHSTIANSGVKFSLKDEQKKLKNHLLLDTLVIDSMLKSNEAKKILHDFIVDSISKILGVNPGSYLFFRIPVGGETTSTDYRFKVPEVILEAARYAAGRGEIAELLYGWDSATVTPLLNSYLSLDKFKIDANEQHLFGLCMVGGRLKEIIERLAPQDKLGLNLALAFIYALAQADLIQLTGMKERPSPKPAETKPAETKPAETKPAELKLAEPAPVPIAKPADNKSTQIAELEAERNRLALLDPFQKLGVERSASNEDIRKCYLKLAKAYHPDTTPQGTGQDYKLLKDSIFAMLSDAFKNIETGEKREAFLAAEAEGPDAAGMVRKIFAAEELVTRAKLFAKNGKDIGEAHKIAEQARALNPGDPEVRIIYFWTLWLLKGASGDKALMDTVIEELRRALKDRATADGWLYLGLIYNTAGDKEHAEDAFKQVLRLDQSNRMASIHLKLLEKRH